MGPGQGPEVQDERGWVHSAPAGLLWGLHLPIFLFPCRVSLCMTWRWKAARLPRARLGPRWGWAAAS